MRKTLAMLAGAATAFTPFASANAAQASDDVSAAATLREKIVDRAYTELNDKSRNREVGGANCNFYSDYFGVGGTGCSNGWRTQAWCADFAHFVWKYGEVRDPGQLTSAANSFYRYGVNHGTWRNGTAGIQPGDAVVYDYDHNMGTVGGHVGIVVYVDGSDIRVISGNWGGGVGKHQLSAWHDYIGYSRPVA